MYKRAVKILFTFFLLVPAMLCTFSAGADSGPVPFIGEIRLFAFDIAPEDGIWAPADGQTLMVDQHPDLFSLIGSTYGGDGMNTFALPDLNREGSVNPLGSGKGKYYIAVSGIYPSSGTDTFDMVRPYLGEIRLFLHPAATPVPMGWHVCNGDTLSTSEYAPLYSLFSINYGGNYTDFALPDLRGLEPVPGSRYCICTNGYLSLITDGKKEVALSNVYTGEIRLFAISAGSNEHTPPADWLRCDGQSLSNSDYPGLFSLLGTMYGGGGGVFNLPRLDGGSNPANPWNETNLGTYCIVADEEYAIDPSGTTGN